jgi:hemerythrin-like domain-containing protein
VARQQHPERVVERRRGGRVEKIGGGAGRLHEADYRPSRRARKSTLQPAARLLIEINVDPVDASTIGSLDHRSFVSRRAFMIALQIIHDEHRALAAVLHGLAFLVRQVRERGDAPDFAVLSAMIYYIDAFPERFHHPKEDRYLFTRLRARWPAAGTMLDVQEAEHVSGAARIRSLEQALTRYQGGGAAEFASFASEVESYVEFEGEHMRREERQILPLAEKYLTAGDWAAIDKAFAEHSDPLLGVEPGEQWRELFRRIVNIAPPPIGVGPAHRL